MVKLTSLEICRGTSNAFGAPYERRPGDGSLDVSLDELSAYGNDRWEVRICYPFVMEINKEKTNSSFHCLQGMLKFMVSSSANIFEAAERPNKAVTRLLVQSGLMSYR
jgi:hypothetical protein